MEGIDLTTLTELAGSVSLSIVLLYLLVREQRMHEVTRVDARADRERHIGEMTELLKEIAGIRANMWNVQSYRNREDGTRPGGNHTPEV